MNHPH